MTIKIGDAFIYYDEQQQKLKHLYFVVAIYEKDYYQKYLMYNTTTKWSKKNTDFLIIPEESKTPPFIRCQCTICYNYSLDLTENKINRLIKHKILVYDGKFCQEIMLNIQNNIVNSDISEEKRQIILQSISRLQNNPPEKSSLFG